MKPEDRGQWILNWIKENCRPRECVDVLYADFVWDYLEATKAPRQLVMFGAPKCKQLGRDLGALYTLGFLERHTTGLAPGDSSMGFPKWVYSYRLKEENETN